MRCIQVVGYKNRGKTTVLEYLIAYFSQRKYKVGACKHHGHGGFPLGWTETDSTKHWKAGADLASVEGENMLQMVTSKDWGLKKLLKIYQLFEMEIVFIEGYKHEDQAKIVVIGEGEDLSLLDQVSNIQAVVTSVPFLKNVPFPVFSSNHLSNLAEWLENQWLMEGKY